MKAKVRPRGTGAARVIQVIETKSMRGLGENDDPVRIVTHVDLYLKLTQF